MAGASDASLLVTLEGPDLGSRRDPAHREEAPAGNPTGPFTRHAASPEACEPGSRSPGDLRRWPSARRGSEPATASSAETCLGPATAGTPPSIVSPALESGPGHDATWPRRVTEAAGSARSVPEIHRSTTGGGIRPAHVAAPRHGAQGFAPEGFRGSSLRVGACRAAGTER